MNKFMISNNTRDAHIQLKAMKQALLDLSSHCEDNGIELSCATNGYMICEIQEINEMLEA